VGRLSVAQLQLRDRRRLLSIVRSRYLEIPNFVLNGWAAFRNFDWSSIAQERNFAPSLMLLFQMLAPFVMIAAVRFQQRHAQTSAYLRSPSFEINQSQAVDLWYQETCRAADTEASVVKFVSIGAGLGIAATATLLAVPGVQPSLLGIAALVCIMSLLHALVASAWSANMHSRRATEFLRCLRGSIPEDNIPMRINNLRIFPWFRDYKDLSGLAMFWLVFGWCDILLAMAMKAGFMPTLEKWLFP
jgi:hypothetical protein